MEDYAINGVHPEHYDDILALYKSEFSNYLENGAQDAGIGIFSSHYHSMMSTWNQTRRLYEEMLDWFAEQGISEWITFREAVSQLGEFSI